MLVRVERTDYLTTWARFRGALVCLIRIIASDQLVDVRPRRRRRHSSATKSGIAIAPSEYCAPESDGA